MAEELMEDYLTVTDRAEAEIVEKKSRFIGRIFHVESEEEAQMILAGIRKQEYGARHNCFAWILGSGGGVKRASDDGEPSGTAGKPILAVLEGSGCTNIMAVVTRYFGGVLLGTGGLVRAYSQSVQAAMENARIVKMCACRTCDVTIGYSYLDRVNYYLEQQGVTRGEAQYTDSVTLPLTVEIGRSDEVFEKLRSLTNGNCVFGEVREGFLAIDNAKTQG